MHQNWWGEAQIAPGLFQALVEEVTSQGWHLVVVENPLHPCYYDQVNAESLAGYNAWMSKVSQHPSGKVHWLALGRQNDDFNLFRDYHHLTCKGEALVKEALDEVLKGISD